MPIPPATPPTTRFPRRILYRDYVIDAFNRDKPYDQFMREQIAGDLLPAASEPEKWRAHRRHRLPGASRAGFNVNPLQYMHLTIDDTVDNFGQTVLGLTIACARCHDHKFDPIPKRDYYALYGIFQSTKYPFPGSEKNHRPAGPDCPAGRRSSKRSSKPYLAELYKITGAWARWRAKSAHTSKGVNPNPHQVKRHPGRDQGSGSTARSHLIAGMPKVEMAYAVAEGNPGNARIQKRGEPKDLGDEVPRGFLQIFTTRNLRSSLGSGRFELAQWVTEPDQSSACPRDGEPALAAPFRQGPGGNAERFRQAGHGRRRIRNCWTTWRHASWRAAGPSKRCTGDDALGDVSASERGKSGEPGSRMPTTIFSGASTASGSTPNPCATRCSLISRQLEPGPGGPHPFPNMGTWVYMQHDPFNAVYPSNRRSVYLMTQRIQRHPYLAMFDGADAAISVARRPLTITPIQALFFMNSELLHSTAATWAKHLIDTHSRDDQRVATAFRTALGRPATRDELARASSIHGRGSQNTERTGTARSRVIWPVT